MPPPLQPTQHYGTITWLGHQPDPVENMIIRAHPLDEMPLSLAGFAGESHAGLTRPSCSRVLNLYPRDTEIRNVRQLSIVCAEEMAAVAAELGLLDWDHAWVGASIVISGIPDFTHIPPSSRLQSDSGLTLTIDMENLPCQEPAKTIEGQRPGHGRSFKAAAKDRRGVTAWVERAGLLRVGDRMRLFVPVQRAWAPGA